MVVEALAGAPADDLPRVRCPYKGLEPYTEADRAYYFGRERDRDVITANLYAAPLTVLYGASGVGKSSVLLAGVVPPLRETPRLAVAVFHDWQDRRFLPALKRQLVDDVARATGRTVDVDPDLPLDELILRCHAVVRGPIFLIFDQFEEFFLYHPPSTGVSGFEAELAAVVNRPDVDAHVLLSLREDGLSKLDRFSGRIANVLGNMLRLDHLDRDDAIGAIRNPLKLYTRRHVPAGQPELRAEDKLVEALLHDVRRGTAGREEPGAGQVPPAVYEPMAEQRIETPLLQMVLIRLWDEELAAGSHTLRLSTLQALGGVEKIARAHLEERLKLLDSPPRLALAMCILPFLVTESGSKIALEPATLAAWAKRDEASVADILKRLAEPDMRILRPVELPGMPTRYEIFHDVMAPAILERCREYEKQQAIEQSLRDEQAKREEQRLQAERQKKEHDLRQRERGFRRVATGSTLLVLVLGGLTFFAFQQRNEAQFQTSEAERQRIEAEHQREVAVSAAATADTARSEEATQRGVAVAAGATAQVAEAQARQLAATAVVAEFEARHREAAQSSLAATAVAAKELAEVRQQELERANAELDKTLSGLADASRQAAASTPVPDQGLPDATWFVLRVDYGAVYGAAFGPDGRVVTAHERGTAVIWPPRGEQPRLVYPSQAGRVYSAAFNDDGTRFVTAGEDRAARVWDASEPQQLALLAGPDGHTDRVLSAVFNPGGELVATAGADGTVRVWDWAGGRLVSVLRGHRAPVTAVTFSPSGRLLAASSDDGIARVWDTSIWRPLGTPFQHAREVTGVAFSRDERLLATSSADATARLWNIETGQPLAELSGHRGRVLSVAFNPDDTLLATSSDDGTARLWDTGRAGSSRPPTTLLGHTDRVYSALFSQDGTQIITASRDGTARVWGRGPKPE